MNHLKIKYYIIMLIIGFIFISLDVNMYTDKSYPNNYDNTKQVIGEFQYYNIASNYGATCTYKLLDSDNTEAQYQSTKVIDQVFYKNIRIDIFNDFAGFLLIALACFKLDIASRKFRFASLCAVGGLVLHGVIVALPFITNGLLLCNAAMIIGILYLLCTVFTTFLFAGGLFEMCSDISCRDERKWGKTCWFISCVLQILVTFVFWLGSDFKMLTDLGWFLEATLILDIVLFWIILYRTRDYIESSYVEAINAKQKRR